ncbi:MAG: hypothetical protein KAS98_11615, partial [Deltaproteobacteria bacterium]|nr:hypothetical protein [Deltaproteobacteria bacterium]
KFFLTLRISKVGTQTAMIIVMMTMLVIGALIGVVPIAVPRAAVVLIPIVLTAIKKARLSGG